MSAHAYARIAERYLGPGSDDEAVERFFLDVAPTLPREEREAILAELQDDQVAPTSVFTTTPVPHEVPMFSIEDAPGITQPTALSQLVGELSAAVEKRVTERLDDVIARAVDRLQEPMAGRRPVVRRGDAAQENVQPPRTHRVAELIEGQPLTVIGHDCTVRTAAQRMAECNVGAVAVLDGGSLTGVISERDIMARVVASGLDPDRTPVSAVMTTELVVVEPHEDVASALRKMYAIGSRHLPVVQDGKLVGMISVRDLLAVEAEAAATFFQERANVRAGL